MAPQRTSKKPSDLTRQESKKARKQADDDSEEINDVNDAEAMDVDDDPHEDEPEETQSTSAQELLSNMVAGVCSCPPNFIFLHTISFHSTGKRLRLIDSGFRHASATPPTRKPSSRPTPAPLQPSRTPSSPYLTSMKSSREYLTIMH
jgi:hypothetical protein